MTTFIFCTMYVLNGEDYMKNVLFISYFYPPSGGAGSLRALHFTRYLPIYAWNPYVISAKSPHHLRKGYIQPPGDVSVHYAKNIFSFIKAKNLPSLGWVVPAFLHGLKIITSKRIDLISVSSPPWPSVIVGVLLKILTGYPLVVEFRDPWSFNPSTPPGRIRKIFSQKIEKICLEYCDYFITVTKTLLESYQKKYPFLKSKSALIYNGVDQKELPAHVEDASSFTITFVGNVYKSYVLGFKAFLQGISNLDQEIRNNINVVVISYRKNLLEPLVEEYGLENHVEWHTYLSYKKTLAHICASHMLLLIIYFETDVKVYKHVLTTRIFDYLASGNPILALIPDGEAAQMIRKYSDSSYIVPDYDPEKVTKALLEIYTTWEKKNIKISGKTIEFREKFNREEETRQLTAIFDALVK
jgi:glycosyltransferase involved in cell wall biosynthesis